jgi:four helix bundle protein
MRRASVSVSSYSTEGFGRISQKEKIQFYFRAQGSLTEIHSQFIIAQELNYLKTRDFDVGLDLIKQTSKLLNGLIRAVNKSIK